MKRAASFASLLAASVLACAYHPADSTPAASIAPAGSAKMTPDQPVSETTAAGKDAEDNATADLDRPLVLPNTGESESAVVSETTDSGGVDGHALVVAKGDGTHGSGRARVSPPGCSLEEAGSSYQAEPAVGLSISQQMLDACNRLTNCQRVESPALSIAAQQHAVVLANRGYNVNSPLGYAHDGYGDGNPLTRAAAAGFTGSILTPPDAYGMSTRGEVVAPSTSADISGPINGWLGSAGHSKSMLCPTFDSAGFGYAVGPWNNHVFVGMFGNSHAPAPAASAMPAARSAVSYCPSGTCGQAIVPQSYQRRRLFRW